MRSLYPRLALTLLLLASLMQFAAAQLYCTPGIFFTPASLDPKTLSVADFSGAHVTFKYAGVDPAEAGTPNFIIVVPSSGTTPAAVQIVLNPNVTSLLRPSGTYTLSVQFAAVEQPSTNPNCAPVTLKMPDEPPPAIQSVVNSASLEPILSPGVLVSILGSHLTGPSLSTEFNDTGSYPTSVAATSVTFNGVAASLVYVSPNQINAILPFSLAAQTSLQVAVQRFERVSAPVTVTLQDTAPAIFTAAQTGTGQAVVLQQPPNGRLSYNSSNNPVHAGDYLEIFATGQGLWTPPPQSDVVVFSGKLPTTPPVSLTIGGQQATIVYTGPVGGLSIWSVLQVNAIVPNGLSPGDQPLVLRIGSNDNAQQKVTVAVR